jgi:hypothetical protein
MKNKPQKKLSEQVQNTIRKIVKTGKLTPTMNGLNFTLNHQMTWLVLVQDKQVILYAMNLWENKVKYYLSVM